jgi:hypothetical protein
MVKNQDYINLLQSKKEEMEKAVAGFNTHLSMDVSASSLPKFREMNEVTTTVFFKVQEAMYLADVICLFKAFEQTLCTALAVLSEL